MPAVSPTTLGKLRKSQHALRAGYLTVFKGTSVCSGTLTFTIVDYPTSNIIIAVTAGSIASVERGAEVVITDASNNYKGRLRIRQGGSITTTNLPVSEVNKATIELVSGDKFSVLSEHRIRPKFPAGDQTFAPDQLAYTDQNSIVPPLALSGGPVCRWVDTGQTYATISFDGTGSYAVDPDGGSLTHSWTFPSGSSPSSSTSSAPANVQIPVGEHWIKHTVTAGSRSWSQFVPVRVHNAANPPYEVLLESLSGSLQEGWAASFSMFDSLGQAEAPDGALVVFWVEEIIDSAVQSFGAKGRSASKFVGWLRSDETSTNVSEKRLTLNAISSLARLGEIYGSSKAMMDTVSPAAWSEIKDLSVKVAIVQILRWYTTVTEVCDLAFDFTDYAYPSFPLQKTTPPEMARELADAVDSRLACDRNGRLEVQLHPELTARSSRAAMTTTVTLAEEDIIEFTLRRDHADVVDLLECRGITQVGAPFFSRYPGVAPGEGASNTVNVRLITTSQDELNTRCGLRGAWLDKLYINTSRVRNQAPQATVVLFGAYDVFDFYREWVAFSLGTTTNWRKVALSDFRWMIQSIQVEYIGGTATVTLQLQAETGADAGTTYTPPAPDPSTIPDYEPDVPYFPPVPNQQGYMPLTDNIVAITIDGRLLRTTNFTDTTPIWSTVDISASIPAEVVVMRVDPRSPCYLGTGSALNVWVMSLDGIYHIANAESGSPTVTAKFFFEAPLIDKGRAGMDIAYTINPGTRGICYYFNDLVNEGWFASMSDGVNWSGSGEEFSETAVNMNFYNVTIDPHSGDEYTYNRSEDNYPNIVPYVNGIADDSYLLSGGAHMGTRLTSMYFPFAINPAHYMWAVRISSGGAAQLYVMDVIAKTGFGGSDAPDLDNVGPYIGNAFVISSPSGNANKLMYAAATASGASLQYTENALEFGAIQWTEIGKSLIADWIGCAMVDPDGEGAYCWGSGAIYFWTGGTTLVAKNGTGFTSSDVIAIAGF